MSWCNSDVMLWFYNKWVKSHAVRLITDDSLSYKWVSRHLTGAKTITPSYSSPMSFDRMYGSLLINYQVIHAHAHTVENYLIAVRMGLARDEAQLIPKFLPGKPGHLARYWYCFAHPLSRPINQVAWLNIVKANPGVVPPLWTGLNWHVNDDRHRSYCFVFHIIPFFHLHHTFHIYVRISFCF